MLSYPHARNGYMVYGHIHNNVRDDYWPLIARRSRMLNAGADINNFEPVTFEEMIENNRAFIDSHEEEAKQNPLTMFCLEE
jgi:calcineurin-like phosphoesterase family protein